MQRKSRINNEIREFILQNVESNPHTVSSLTVEQFGVSRTTVSKYMQILIDEGLLEAEGSTKGRKYRLRKIVSERFEIKLFYEMPEDAVWRHRILPLIKNAKQNVVDICQYGFTEMLNNAIDHSASETAKIWYEQTYKKIKIHIIDSGIGVFEKIRQDFELSDARSALLELSKGKLTSDKRRHSGEGIFFTSRMFEQFTILSGDLFYRRKMNEDGWLIEAEDTFEHINGTCVEMIIPTQAEWTRNEIFQYYLGDDIRFRKTHVPIALGKYPGEELVSRSQAKRILARFENFSEVFLDFSGVETIGQAFADEIFRVFKLDHPEIEVIAVNQNEEVDHMIKFVTNQ